MVSYAPMRSFEPLWKRTAETGEDQIPNWMEEIPPTEMG